jgi:hypothetical protein
MRKYTVIAVLGFPAGVVLGLSDDQAGRRKHALKPLGAKGVYETTAPVQFKVGETIATDAAVSKVLATFIEPEEETKAKARDKAKEASATKDLAAIAAKAKQWDDVQVELEALRGFVGEIEALPKELLDQVKAAVEAKRAADANKVKK